MLENYESFTQQVQKRSNAGEPLNILLALYFS